MKRIVVFGIGNLIMQDDGIGVRVVKAIQKDLTAHDIITIIVLNKYYQMILFLLLMLCIKTKTPETFR